MSQNPSINAARHEPAHQLDLLLADFFHSQLKQPWPPAPATRATEPSALLASRNGPVSPRDYNRKSRFTLVVSVALLLGACWLFSSGFAPSVRLGSGPAPRGEMLKDAGAAKPAALEELHKDDAITGRSGQQRKKAPHSPFQLP